MMKDRDGTNRVPSYSIRLLWMASSSLEVSCTTYKQPVVLIPTKGMVIVTVSTLYSNHFRRHILLKRVLSTDVDV